MDLKDPTAVAAETLGARRSALDQLDGLKAHLDATANQPGTVPSWMPSAAIQLIDLAEQFLPGVTGAERKRWVIARLQELAAKHDIKQIPNWIEGPAEKLIISIVVESLFKLGAPQLRAVHAGALAERR